MVKTLQPSFQVLSIYVDNLFGEHFQLVQTSEELSSCSTYINTIYLMLSLTRRCMLTKGTMKFSSMLVTSFLWNCSYTPNILNDFNGTGCCVIDIYYLWQTSFRYSNRWQFLTITKLLRLKPLLVNVLEGCHTNSCIHQPSIFSSLSKQKFVVRFTKKRLDCKGMSYNKQV